MRDDFCDSQKFQNILSAGSWVPGRDSVAQTALSPWQAGLRRGVLLARSCTHDMRCFSFGIWSFSGAWFLELGAFMIDELRVRIVF
jgi:hypothetical protein